MQTGVQALAGPQLQMLFGRFQSLLAKNLQAIAAGKTQFDLLDLIEKVMFAASVDSLFGEGTYSPQVLADFHAFSNSMSTRSAGSDPSLGNAKGVEARERLLKVVANKRPDAAEAIKSLSTLVNDSKYAPEAHLAALMAMWGANVNTVPSAFWTIIQLLHQPAQVRDQLKQEHVAAGGHPTTRADLSEEARPLLHSVVSEALRLHSRPNSYRVARSDCTVGEYAIEEGQWVWIYPRASLHHDPAAFPDPLQFQPSRFVAKEGHPPMEFDSASLRAFGGGTGPCPGKGFALLALKATVDLLINQSTAQLGLADPNAPIPEAVTETVASTPPPVHSVDVTFTKTCSSCHRRPA